MTTASKRRIREKFEREMLPKITEIAAKNFLHLEEFAHGHWRMMNDRGHNFDFWTSGTFMTVDGTAVSDNEEGIFRQILRLIQLSEQEPAGKII